MLNVHRKYVAEWTLFMHSLQLFDTDINMYSKSRNGNGPAYSALVLSVYNSALNHTRSHKCILEKNCAFPSIILIASEK
jgi:hypothetical protein